MLFLTLSAPVMGMVKLGAGTCPGLQDTWEEAGALGSRVRLRCRVPSACLVPQAPSPWELGWRGPWGWGGALWARGEKPSLQHGASLSTHHSQKYTRQLCPEPRKRTGSWRRMNYSPGGSFKMHEPHAVEGEL